MAYPDGLTDLVELSGSGDNVLVKARVTYEADLATHRPYQKGLLWDQSMTIGDVRSFVIYDPVLRLEPGKVYILNGTDYYYERRGEIQLLLGEDAFVKELYDTRE